VIELEAGANSCPVWGRDEDRGGGELFTPLPDGKRFFVLPLLVKFLMT
jgi:hypothetical protein